jgi:hypothetical protein
MDISSITGAVTGAVTNAVADATGIAKDTVASVVDKAADMVAEHITGPAVEMAADVAHVATSVLDTTPVAEAAEVVSAAADAITPTV